VSGPAVEENPQALTISLRLPLKLPPPAAACCENRGGSSGSRNPADGGINAARTAKFSRNRVMLPFVRLFLVGLVPGLGGCAAVPLAEVAASHMATAAPACAGGAACQTGAVADPVKSATDAWHRLTGPAADTQKVASDSPAK
jgi:hypothetical protein